MKNIVSTLVARVSSVYAALTSPVRTVDAGVYFGRNVAGIYVDELKALRLATVWACVKVISESIAVLPWQVFRREKDRRVLYDNHPAAWLLGNQANPDTTAFAFREVLVASAALWGDGYAEIERDAANRPVWLWQIEPWRVTPERNEIGRLQFRVKNYGEPDSIIPQEDMLHLHGLSLDGITGLNPIRYGSDSIALALAMEQFGAAFFGNGSNPSGLFETETGMSPESVAAFKEQYKKATNGPRNARKDLVLPKGMKWKQISVQPEDSQFNDSRYQQVEDVARRYRVPPHKIGHLLRSTNNNIEHQAIEFVQDCLMPWCVRLEQEANIKLFGRALAGTAYTKLNLMGLLRGDAKSQADAFKVGRDGGWWSVNDIRRMLDQDPIGDQGDKYLVPMNMIDAASFEDFSETKASPPTPAPAASTDPTSNDGTSTDPEDDSTDGSTPSADRQQSVKKKVAHMLKVIEGGQNA